jgi:type I restriction enzyme M protein
VVIKKSQIYGMLWKSCDELRGGMDASQYKDFVLAMLFIKYISDKSKNDKNFLIEIPKGCSFDDFVKLKGNVHIGEEVNKKMAKIAETNNLSGVVNVADFCDENKLGAGKDLVQTVGNLIGVFQDSGLDFGSNRSADDDLMGDAYEYLMKNFAAESGKSKGQFYTPAEVSRIIAQVINLDKADSVSKTIYDPTCGSGSLLLKALSATPNGKTGTIYGQEKDSATAGLAKMNMILHGVDTADIRQGDIIGNPRFLSENDSNALETFDFVIANPPFSTKSWLKGAKEEDIYGRWNSSIGIPPEKNGDYAFLLHIIRSMNRTGKGACILPHGVLFRGNAERNIRKYIIGRGYIEGIIGMPANLFFGTGIPACIIILDKKNADNRKGIFIIDAKNGFTKDGPKNRLREQDVRRIVDVWNKRQDIEHYARFVENSEITANDYNLNIPRYIETVNTDIEQDIEAHLKGGLPRNDIDKFSAYWTACPNLRSALFSPIKERKGYFSLKCKNEEVRQTIERHKDFISQIENYNACFNAWSKQVKTELQNLTIGSKPKKLIKDLSDKILKKFGAGSFLADIYGVYERLLVYWNETMQDDCYLISANGWKAPLSVAAKPQSPQDLSCGLLPVEIAIDEFFIDIKQKIESAQENMNSNQTLLDELIEQESGNYLDVSNFDNEKLNENNIKKRIQELDNKKDSQEIAALEKYLSLKEQIYLIKKEIKSLNERLCNKLIEKYKSLTEIDIKRLVIDKKWFSSLSTSLNGEMQTISQNLTASIIALSQRYKQTLSEIDNEIADIEKKVNNHLKSIMQERQKNEKNI